MDYHHHARLTVVGREGLAKSVVEGRLSLREAAAERGLSRQSAGKWVRRYRDGGVEALGDRSSRPRRLRQSTTEEQIARVEALRRERWTGVRIAQATGLSRATVSRILVRLKLNKVRHLEPKVAVVRYEREAPGDLLHIDIKKLARIHKPGHRLTGNPQDETRGAGWEFLYVAVDDHSRMAYVAMMPDEKAVSASSFLRQAHDYFARHNIHLRGVMTDNGPCFISDLFRDTNRSLGLKHIRTRIYTPRTNGKAERFIQTAIREWAYARIYQNSAERNSFLEPWIHQYNWHRPHASLNQLPPISRSGLDVNNLLRHHRNGCLSLRGLNQSCSCPSLCHSRRESAFAFAFAFAVAFALALPFVIPKGISVSRLVLGARPLQALDHGRACDRIFFFAYLCVLCGLRVRSFRP